MCAPCSQKPVTCVEAGPILRAETSYFADTNLYYTKYDSNNANPTLTLTKVSTLIVTDMGGIARVCSPPLGPQVL